MSPHLPCSRQFGAPAMRRFVLISLLVAYCAVLGALFLASYRFTPIEYHSYVGAAWMLLLIAIILCVRLYRRFAKGEVLALDGLIVMSVYLASLAAMALSAFLPPPEKVVGSRGALLRLVATQICQALWKKRHPSA